MKSVFSINDDWNSSQADVLTFKTHKKKTQDKQPTSKRKREINNESSFKSDKINSRTTNKTNSPSENVGSVKKEKLKQKKQRKSIKEPKKELIKEIVKNEKDLNKNSFAEKLRLNLKGGHFRFLNEKLYTTDGSAAKKMFEENPADFTAYHEGYRHQVEQWPLNPLERVIKYTKKMPNHITVADFGCGEGCLAKSVPQKVYSMDLVAVSPDITACDMANTPLEDKCIDLGVYCLSLMGTNIKDFVLEANRVIKMGGTLYVAEIASRFQNVQTFIKRMASWGFDLVTKDVSHKLFYFFIFKKVKIVQKSECLENFSLKPCFYKKR